MILNREVGSAGIVREDCAGNQLTIMKCKLYYKL